MKNPNTNRWMEAARTELQAGGSITHDPGRRALLGRSATAVAAGVTARVRQAPVSIDALRTLAESEAFAAQLRERGRAPPPIPRR